MGNSLASKAKYILSALALSAAAVSAHAESVKLLSWKTMGLGGHNEWNVAADIQYKSQRYLVSASCDGSRAYLVARPERYTEVDVEFGYWKKNANPSSLHGVLAWICSQSLQEKDPFSKSNIEETE